MAPRSRAQATTLRRCSAGSTWPVGLDGRVHPDQRGPLRARARAGRPSAVRLGPGQPGPHVVGGVGQLGEDDHVARADPEQRRQPGDELLGADRGSTSRRVDGDPVPAPQPARRRLAQPRRPVGRRIAGAVGGLGQRAPDDAAAPGPRGCRPRGRRSRPGCAAPLLVRRAAGPTGSPAARSRFPVRHVRRPADARAAPCARRRPAARSPAACGPASVSSACGGSAATIGWSLSILPTLEAPPGEPRSSKNSTFAL